MNLIQRAVSKGGKLAPLIIGNDPSVATGLMNPSILVDADGDILVNLRKVNYTLYTSEKEQKFPCPFGPLSYLHPENDQHLRTTNYLLKLDKDLNVVSDTEVQMLNLHTAIWTFVGLEDARLIQWPDYEDPTKLNYYLVGVRRDTTTNGQGRMEYTQLEVDKENWNAKEIHRLRIPAPAPNDSYCEKNWEPILDRPYHFVKWSMPTEIVKARPDIPSCNTIAIKPTPPAPRDQRGGTPVVKWGDYYIAITHEVWLWWNYLKQKDSVYRHRMIVWDKDFNFVGLTENFSFLETPIEFCIGAAIYEGDLLLGVGVQDNCAYILRTPKEVIDEMIQEAISAYTPNYEVDEKVYEVPNYAKFKVYKEDLISDVIKKGEKWEPLLQDVFDKYITKESVVLEGGAHIGTHTIKLAQLANKVFCFEPLDQSRTLLEDNLKLNDINNVVVSSQGLSDVPSHASFAYVNNGNIGGAVLGEGSGVYITSIDALPFDRLDFIKLDIEGYEKQALLGGIETIKRCKPIIALECWDNYPNATLEHAEKEFKFLLDLGYKIEQIDHHDFLFRIKND